MDVSSVRQYVSIPVSTAGVRCGSSAYDAACGKLLSATTPYRPGEYYTAATAPRTRHGYDNFCRRERTELPDQAAGDARLVFFYALGAPRTPTGVGVGSIDPSSDEGIIWRDEFFDALGRPLQTQREAEVDGALKVVVEATAVYDDRGDPVQRHDPWAAVRRQQREYRPNPPAGRGSTLYEYDGLRRPTRVTNADGSFRTLEYDVPRQTTTKDECYHEASCAGAKTVEIRDAFGRVVETRAYDQDTLVTRTGYTYDAGGRLRTQTQGTTLTGWDYRTTITHTYDTLGRRVQTADPDAGEEGDPAPGIWQFGYDLAGNLIYRDDPQLGQHHELCYDALNRLRYEYAVMTGDAYEAVSCGSAADFSYAYDERHPDNLGRLTTVSDRSGTTRFEYDLRGRTLSESREITVDGRTTTAEFGRTYDDADHLTTLTYPDGENVTHTYGDAGQLIGVAGSAEYVEDIRYDLYGRVTEIKHGNTFVDTRTYADHTGGHRLAALATKKGSTPWLGYSYPDYTATGRLRTLQDTAGAGTARDNSAAYTYDGMGRLLAATGPQLGSHSYTYDGLGNLTEKDGSAYVYDAGHPHRVTAIATVAVSTDGNGNRSAARGQTYAYDAENRLTGIAPAGVEVRYDYRGQRTVQMVSGGNVTRYYGRLAEATGPYLTKYYYAGEVLVASQRVSGVQLGAVERQPAVRLARLGGVRPAVVALVRDDVGTGVVLAVAMGGTVCLCVPWGRRRRVVGVAVRPGHVVGVLLAFGVTTVPLGVRPAWAGGGGGATPTVTPTPPGGSDTLGVLHYHADHLGSTQLVTRTSAPWDYRHTRYGAYGEVRGHYGATPTPRPGCEADGYCREFTGYDTEARSGLQYAQARFYDPELGMFLTHDPAREFASPYGYVGWDPVNGTDPSGACELLCVVVIAAVAGAVANTIQAAVSGAPGGQIAGAAVTGALTSGVSAGIGFAVVGPALNATVVPAVANLSGWSAEAVRQAATLTALGGSIGQAGYGLSQGDYSGLIGLGLTVGLTYAYAGSGAQGGNGDLAAAQGAKQSDEGTIPLLKACNGGDVGACGRLETINTADLGAARDAIAKIDPYSLTDPPRVRWDGTMEFFGERSGSTDFWFGDITLSRGYASRADLVQTLSHELQHSNSGILGRAITNFQDHYFPVPGTRWGPGLGSMHISIWERATLVRKYYEGRVYP